MIGDGFSRGCDWRQAEDYAYTERLTRRDWAWEFLRRNDTYRQAWPEARKSVLTEALAPDLTLLTALDMLPGMRHWGLVFRG